MGVKEMVIVFVIALAAIYASNKVAFIKSFVG
jgi:hypothetical protein